ncbi:MAG: hypothetical protein FJ403_08960 [Verrucomicrobia bacterium]|nr:hypothetical protein [Verrucomicrobiota bacterium]
MKLAELAQTVEQRHYGVVATNAQRYERRLEHDRAEPARMKQVLELLTGLVRCDPALRPEHRQSD